MLACGPMRWTNLACLLGTVLCTTQAWAGTVRVEGGVAVSWPEPHVTYYLQAAGSDDLAPEVALEAVYKAFDSWMEIDCSDLTFEELGDAPDPTVSVLAGGSANLQNEVVWLEGDDWTLGGYVLGVTAPISEGDGVLVEADIAFNGLHITWKTGGGKGTDLESVAVHEIGHMFGQQHNLGPYPPDVEKPTMHPNILSKKRSRSLEADDAIGVCFLYPVDEVYPCESDDDCPYIMKHDSQGDEYYGGQFLCAPETLACEKLHYYPTKVSELGEFCEHDSSCMDDLFCQPWLDSGICTTYCVVEDEACGEDYYCAAFQSWPEFGACLPTDGEIAPPSGILPGCQSGFDCNGDDICLPSPDGASKLCTSLCTAADPVECDEDEFCHVYQEGNPTGGCFPVPTPEPEPEPEPE
ncbi:MAG: matrixin family metalloprotease, partial [Myxococcota bacterium]|nr:matrixin family metalloprotease [Myxococcota bacterium]